MRNGKTKGAEVEGITPWHSDEEEEPGHRRKENARYHTRGVALASVRCTLRSSNVRRADRPSRGATSGRITGTLVIPTSTFFFSFFPQSCDVANLVIIHKNI
jgi:hypothetical protein